MKKKANLRMIKLCNSFSRAYFPLLFANSLVNNLRPYFNLYFSAEIVNEIAGKRNVKYLMLLVLTTIIGNFTISMLGNFISKLMSEKGLALSHRETRCFTQKLLHMDYIDLENPSIRQMRRKISESAKINGHGKELLIKSIARVVDALMSALFILLFLAELFAKSYGGTSGQFTGVFFLSLSLLVCAEIFYNIKSREKNAKEANSVSQTMIENNRIDNAIDNYNMGKDIRLYCQDSIIMRIKNQRLTSHRQAFGEFSKFQAKSAIPIYIVSTMTNIIVYIYLAYNAIGGAIGVGSVIKYVGLSQKIIEAIMSIFRGVADIKANRRYVEDYFAYLDIPCVNQKESTTAVDRQNSKYIVEFRNVSFKYPSSKEYALKNVNIKIMRGNRVGIVGRNGSGKTTFVKLLCGLYSPTEGDVFFNGVNIKEFDQHDYLSMIAVVFQDFRLFSFELGANVAGTDEYKASLVEESLREVGFAERLAKMEKGVRSYLFKDFDCDGIELSGGEAQKIALARALYKNAPLIILDEPTAALDPISECAFYSKFNDMLNQKTGMCISHRLSSCRCCDKIMVFQGGELVQFGSHQELVENTNGEYYQLWAAQANYYTE